MGFSDVRAVNSSQFQPMQFQHLHSQLYVDLVST